MFSMKTTQVCMAPQNRYIKMLLFQFHLLFSHVHDRGSTHGQLLSANCSFFLGLRWLGAARAVDRPEAHVRADDDLDALSDLGPRVKRVRPARRTVPPVREH